MPPSITILLEVNLDSDSETPHPPTEPHKLGCHEPQFCIHSAGAFAAIKMPPPPIDYEGAGEGCQGALWPKKGESL